MTTDSTKPIPKSLHTVTVLVKLCHHFETSAPGFTLRTRADNMNAALSFLGYENTPDTHNLAAAALKVMGQ